MITSFDIIDSKKDRIPAVIHVDSTVRPQTAKRLVNTTYCELLKTFGDLTGEYLLLNSSFNIKEQPIINSPFSAIRCFFGTGLDVLIMGSFVLIKNSTLKSV
jgi:carbamoyltransferase